MAPRAITACSHLGLGRQAWGKSSTPSKRTRPAPPPLPLSPPVPPLPRPVPPPLTSLHPAPPARSGLRGALRSAGERRKASVSRSRSLPPGWRVGDTEIADKTCSHLRERGGGGRKKKKKQPGLPELRAAALALLPPRRPGARCPLTLLVSRGQGQSQPQQAGQVRPKVLVPPSVQGLLLSMFSMAEPAHMSVL